MVDSQNIKDIKELYELLFEGIQEDITSLREKNLSLREHVAELQKKLNIEGEIKCDGSVYWLGDDGPYCRRCFDVDGKLARLEPFEDQWVCGACESRFDNPRSREDILPPTFESKSPPS